MKYDGEVLIHAGITTDDISKDVKEVSGELGGLGKVLQKLGFKISNAMSKPVTGTVKQIKKDIDDCAKALEKYRAQLQKAEADKSPWMDKAKAIDADMRREMTVLEDLIGQRDEINDLLRTVDLSNPANSARYDTNVKPEIERLNAEIDQQQAKVNVLKDQWRENNEQIDKYVKQIDQANQLIAANEQKAAELADELKEAEKAAEGVRKNNKSASGEMDKMGKTVRSFGSRLKSIVMGAFIFNGISAGLRELTSYFGSVLKTNQAFTAELSKLKGALLTAFQPIYNAVAPALTQLIKLLTSAVLAVAQFFAAISGTSLEANAEAAKDLYEQANALDSVGGAAKKASKAMAGFDEINTLQDPNASGGGAGSSGATEPDFSFGDWDEAAGKGIVDTIGLIVAAISGLSLGKFIADLLTANTKIDNMTDAIKLFGKKAKITAGVALTITGAFMETKGIIDALTNGLNTGSLFEIFGGGVSFTTGLSTTLGTILPKVTIMGKQIGGSALGAASGAILSGIPALITGIHDAAQNGLNWMNGSLVAASATAIGAGIGTLFGPVGTGIGALIGLAGGLITDGILAIGQTSTIQAVEVLTEAEKELIATASQAADAFQQQQAATQEAMGDKTAQMDYISSLADELFTLADASGTVTEKDRARVNFILGKLNSALGTEYQLVGNVITNYDTLQTSIQDVIAAKTANALLEAGNADYIKAIQEEDAALDRARLAQKEYEDQKTESEAKIAELLDKKTRLEIEYQAKKDTLNDREKLAYELSIGRIETEMGKYRQFVKDKEEALDDATADYENYHTTILNYQAAQEAAYRGDYETAKDLLLKKEEDLSAYSDIVDKEVARNLAALEKAAIDAGIAAQNERENWEKGMDGFTEESVREAEEGYKAALAAYDNAYEDAYGKGRDVGTGLADSFEDSKKSVWQKAKELMAAAFNGMNSAGSSSGTAAAIASSAVSQSMYSLRSPTATPAIPQLARGAVLPANKPFMAVVGDQRHGTNVEAPLATIQEAVALVMADQMGGMMAGFNAVTERQERILQAIFGLDISDGALAAAVQRHQDKMATVTGGIA